MESSVGRVRLGAGHDGLRQDEYVLRVRRVCAVIQFIVLGVIILAMIAALVFVMRWGMKAKDEAAHAADRMHSQGKLSDEAIAALVVDRDQWKQKHDVAASQLAAAKVRLATAETQRNNSAQAATIALVEKVKAGTAATAAEAVNDLLMSPLSGADRAVSG